VSTRIELGRFGRPHGIRGAVWLWPHNESSDLLKPGRTIQVGTTADDVRGYEVEEARRDGAGYVLRLKGVADRDLAGSLNGMLWYEVRENFPPPAADEYYHVDLVGLMARSEDGAVIGRIDEVWDAPASVILVIHGDREVLVPFVETYLSKVDVAGGEVVLRNLDGLLNPDADENEA
jgi:16S rRNA processing protein RimM